jgi:hypothetical protein
VRHQIVRLPDGKGGGHRGELNGGLHFAILVLPSLLLSKYVINNK